MAMRFLAQMRSLFVALSPRSFEATLPNGMRIIVWPRDRVVLPVIAGGAPGEDNAEQENEKDKEKEGESEAKKAEEEKDNEAEEKEAEEEVERKKEPDWKAESRKHERRSKKEREAREAAEKKLQEREDEDKTEQQKAIDKAREEGKTEALTVAEKERRKDRLESAVTRAAGKKITIGEGEEAKEVRFDDPEDAEVFLQRKIVKGDLDEDDLFDSDGKVKADVVAEALKEILEEKPRLAEDSGDGSGKKKTANGSADQGKGGGSGGEKNLEEMSPEEHEKRKEKNG